MKKLCALFAAIGGFVAGVLFATKEGKKVRQEMAGKEPEEAAKVLGKAVKDAGEEAVIDVHYDAPAGQPFAVRLYQRMHGTVVGGISHEWIIPADQHRIYLPLLMRGY